MPRLCLCSGALFTASIGLLATWALPVKAQQPQQQLPMRKQPGMIQPSARPQPQVPEGGPSTHQVLSASSTDGLTWTRDPGVRLEQASVPCALSEPDRVILYFVDGALKPSTTGCAISTDGMTFSKQPVTIDGNPGTLAADPSIAKDTSGTYCLYYLMGNNRPGDPGGGGPNEIHEIHLATGTDPARFKEIGAVLKQPALVDPDVFAYRGSCFMYVFSNGKTIIATSPTGLDFKVTGTFSPVGYGTVAPVLLSDGRLRMYAFDQGRRSGNAFFSFVSSDGLNWTQEPGVRLQADSTEHITDPYVVSWRGAYKMYFKREARSASSPERQQPKLPGQIPPKRQL